MVELIERAIEKKEFRSPYYVNEWPVLYFISRWYRGEKSKEIVDYAVEHFTQRDGWDNPLDTALAMCTLLNLRSDQVAIPSEIHAAFEHLKKAQQVDGSWPAYPLVIERIKSEQKQFSGSAALTSVFCIQALQLYARSQDGGHIISTDVRTHFPREKEKQAAVELVLQRTYLLKQCLQAQFYGELDQLLASTSAAELLFVSRILHQSLGSSGSAISHNQLTQLDAAALFGWIAYSTYDDLIDGEGELKKISIANISLREVTLMFGKIFFQSPSYLRRFNTIMDDLEHAQCWEVSCCRAKRKGMQIFIPQKLPTYGEFDVLAQRSMGCVLGPLALMKFAGNDADCSDVKHLQAFFHHFIIARQLDDDAHDWEIDLEHGRLSPVVTAVLHAFSSSVQGETIDLRKQKSTLQGVFGKEVIGNICKSMLYHLEEAKKHLEQIVVIERPVLMEQLLDPIHRSATIALKEQKVTLDFLRSYGSVVP